MEEIFVPIQDFNDYEISNHGNVRAHKGQRSYLLKPQKDAMGYLHVRLYDGDRFGRYANGSVKPKLCKVHRLVAEHFILNRNILRTDVNHKDGDKTNNYFENLEWCSKSENIQHAWDTGLMDARQDRISRANRHNIKVVYRDGSYNYFRGINYTALALDIAPATIITRLKKQKNMPEGTLFFGRKDYAILRVKELPVGETYKNVLEVEEKLLALREEYYNKYRLGDYYEKRRVGFT